jgi:hypothetical protein
MGVDKEMLFFVHNSSNHQNTSASSVFWFCIQTINKEIIFLSLKQYFFKFIFMIYNINHKLKFIALVFIF